MTSNEAIDFARRDFLFNGARGCGALALATMLGRDGLLAAGAKPAVSPACPLAPRLPPFAPKAKRCIFIYMEGGVSQIDLFDPKPKLTQMNGQKLPESFTKGVRFAFLQKDTATLLASPHHFRRAGQCGMEFSRLLPHLSECADDLALIRSMHTEAFNHHPGELLMYSGFQSTVSRWPGDR